MSLNHGSPLLPLHPSVVMPPVRAARATLLTAAAMAALVTSTTAQRQFDPLPGRALPPIPEPTLALASGDVDGDGDIDLVCGNWNGPDRLFLNRGDATFFDGTSGRLPLDYDDARCLVLGDVDNDGDLDLLVGATGYSSWQIRLYRNDGTGTFSDVTATTMPSTSLPTTFAAGDIDNDGDLDLVLVSGAVLQNSNGVFTLAAPLPVPSGFVASAVTLGDVDNDGDRDVAFAALVAGQERLCRNDGPAGFADVTAANMPPLTDTTLCLLLVDADGDADLDLVTGNGGSPTRLLRNDGTGAFTDVTATHMPAASPYTRAMVAADVDADGDWDLVLGNDSQATLLVNIAGAFVDATATWLPAVVDDTRSLLARDLDQDGRVDLVRAAGFSDPSNHVHVNDGSTFHDACAPRLPQDRDMTWAVAFGDVDGDGDLDLLFGNWGTQNRLSMNLGNGTFADASATNLPPDADHTRAVALGDVDGDGDLDVVFGNAGLYPGPGTQSRLYRNNGLGVFADVTPANLPAVIGLTSAITLADLDQDGDLDCFCGNSGANWFWRNDGSGVFTDVSVTHLPPGSSGANAIGVGDLDGDGDRDLVLGGQNRVYRNNGLGVFTDVTATSWPAGSSVSFLQLGDVDGDGDLDVVGGNWNDGPRLYRNNGAGSFTEDTAASMPFGLDLTTAVALADVDGDGDLDMAIANSGVCSAHGCWGEQSRLLVNDGAGVFTDATATRLPARIGYDMAVAFGDVDGDGDADLLFGSGFALGGAPDHLYVNLHRQLDTPYLLRVGRPYTLEVHSRYGPAGTLDLAMPWLSTTRLSLPLPPFGTLGIDPMAPLPLVLIPQPAGVAATTWNVPNVPSLAGIAVHAQALLLRHPLHANLTDVTSDVLIR